MEKNIQRDQARELFLQTEMTQEQIAQLLNVNRKTIGLWIQKGKWREMKQTALQAPGMILQELYNQLSCLNVAINSRDPAHRYPTIEESTIQRRLMLSVKSYEWQNAGNYMQIYTELIAEIAQGDPALSKEVCRYADNIIRRKYDHDKKTPAQYMFLTDDLDELDELDKDQNEQSIGKETPPDSQFPVTNFESIQNNIPSPSERDRERFETSCDISETQITQQDQPISESSLPSNSQNNIPEKCDKAGINELPKLPNGVTLINSWTVFDPYLNKNREIKIGEVDEFLRLGYGKFLK